MKIPNDPIDAGMALLIASAAFFIVMFTLKMVSTDNLFVPQCQQPTVINGVDNER